MSKNPNASSYQTSDPEKPTDRVRQDEDTPPQRPSAISANAASPTQAHQRHNANGNENENARPKSQMSLLRALHDFTHHEECSASENNK
jgi:hypothetical protein